MVAGDILFVLFGFQPVTLNKAFALSELNQGTSGSVNAHLTYQIWP